MKNRKVCKGCEYYKERHAYPDLIRSCSYMDQTGSSRLKVELDNGGYQTDSCICYKERKRRAKSGSN